MPESPSVIVIDHDPDLRFEVQQVVRAAGFTPAGNAGLGTEGIALAAERAPDIVLCGLREPFQRALQTIEAVAHALPETPVIAFSDGAELDVVRKAMLAGARDFLQSPLKPDTLRRALAGALEATERRRMRDVGSVLGPEGTIIAVYGAKGGVGKTTLSTNLGVAVAQAAGQRAVLVDADVSFGDAAAALSLLSDRSVVDALRELDGDVDGVGDYLVSHDSGLAVAAAPDDPLAWEGVPADRFAGLLHRLARRFDVVIVDTSSALGEITRAALQASSVVLWVTTADYASVRDSLQALQVLRRLSMDEDRIRLLLNMPTPELDVRPSSIEEALGHRIFWTVPYDRTLRRSAQAGRPAVDGRSDAGTAIEDLALALTGARPTGATPDANGGLLRRLLPGRPRARAVRPAIEEAGP